MLASACQFQLASLVSCHAFHDAAAEVLTECWECRHSMLPVASQTGWGLELGQDEGCSRLETNANATGATRLHETLTHGHNLWSA